MSFTNRSEISRNSASESLRALRSDALNILASALMAVDPGEAVRRNVALEGELFIFDDEGLNLEEFSKILVIGGGKASGSMAQAVDGLLGSRIAAGHVNVLKGTECRYPLRHVELNGASHPLPCERGVTGVEAMLSLAEGADEETLVIVLISGGGSALLTLPAEDIALDDMKKVTELLLLGGAGIEEVNSVRKHISSVKGGLLARKLHPATVLSLILSDVIGNPLDAIASGPTAPDATTFKDAVDVLQKRGLWGETPDSVRRHLMKGVKGEIDETPKPGNQVFRKVHNVIVGSNVMAGKAAVEKAVSLGYNSQLLSTSIEGEAAQVGSQLAEIARRIIQDGNPVSPPAAVVLGGETTVTVRGSGVGGRNLEVALSAARGIRGLDAVIATLATDGIDGPTDAAGAVVDGSTMDRAESKGLDAQASLRDNDSYTFFSGLRDALLTGPTGTNVNDIMLILVGKF